MFAFVTKRWDDLGRGPALLGLYAIIAGLLSVLRNTGSAFDGDGVGISRTLVAVLGLAAGALLWHGHRHGLTGWFAVVLWSALQIPVFAQHPDGNPTKQVVDVVLGFTQQVTVNGDVTSYSQTGLNLVGIALTIWAVRSRERLDLWGRRLRAPSPAL